MDLQTSARLWSSEYTGTTGPSKVNWSTLFAQISRGSHGVPVDHEFSPAIDPADRAVEELVDASFTEEFDTVDPLVFLLCLVDTPWDTYVRTRYSCSSATAWHAADADCHCVGCQLRILLPEIVIGVAAAPVSRPRRRAWCRMHNVTAYAPPVVVDATWPPLGCARLPRENADGSESERQDHAADTRDTYPLALFRRGKGLVYIGEPHADGARSVHMLRVVVPPDVGRCPGNLERMSVRVAWSYVPWWSVSRADSVPVAYRTTLDISVLCRDQVAICRLAESLGRPPRPRHLHPRAPVGAAPPQFAWWYSRTQLRPGANYNDLYGGREIWQLPAGVSARAGHDTVTWQENRGDEETAGAASLASPLLPFQTQAVSYMRASLAARVRRDAVDGTVRTYAPAYTLLGVPETGRRGLLLTATVPGHWIAWSAGRDDTFEFVSVFPCTAWPLERRKQFAAAAKTVAPRSVTATALRSDPFERLSTVPLGPEGVRQLPSVAPTAAVPLPSRMPRPGGGGVRAVGLPGPRSQWPPVHRVAFDVGMGKTAVGIGVAIAAAQVRRRNGLLPTVAVPRVGGACHVPDMGDNTVLRYLLARQTDHAESETATVSPLRALAWHQSLDATLEEAITRRGRRRGTGARGRKRPGPGDAEAAARTSAARRRRLANGYKEEQGAATVTTNTPLQPPPLAYLSGRRWDTPGPVVGSTTTVTGRLRPRVPRSGDNDDDDDDGASSLVPGHAGLVTFADRLRRCGLTGMVWRGGTAIVVPGSLVNMWQAALEKFAPHLRVHTVRRPAARAFVLDEFLPALRADVVLVPFAALPRIVRSKEYTRANEDVRSLEGPPAVAVCASTSTPISGLQALDLHIRVAGTGQFLVEFPGPRHLTFLVQFTDCCANRAPDYVAEATTDAFFPPPVLPEDRPWTPACLRLAAAHLRDNRAWEDILAFVQQNVRVRCVQVAGRVPDGGWGENDLRRHLRHGALVEVETAAFLAASRLVRPPTAAGTSLVAPTAEGLGAVYPSLWHLAMGMRQTHHWMEQVHWQAIVVDEAHKLSVTRWRSLFGTSLATDHAVALSATWPSGHEIALRLLESPGVVLPPRLRCEVAETRTLRATMNTQYGDTRAPLMHPRRAARGAAASAGTAATDGRVQWDVVCHHWVVPMADLGAGAGTRVPWRGATARLWDNLLRGLGRHAPLRDGTLRRALLRLQWATIFWQLPPDDNASASITAALEDGANAAAEAGAADGRHNPAVPSALRTVYSRLTAVDQRLLERMVAFIRQFRPPHARRPAACDAEARFAQEPVGVGQETTVWGVYVEQALTAFLTTLFRSTEATQAERRRTFRPRIVAAAWHTALRDHPHLLQAPVLLLPWCVQLLAVASKYEAPYATSLLAGLALCGAAVANRGDANAAPYRTWTVGHLVAGVVPQWLAFVTCRVHPSAAATGAVDRPLFHANPRWLSYLCRHALEFPGTSTQTALAQPGADAAAEKDTGGDGEDAAATRRQHWLDGTGPPSCGRHHPWPNVLAPLFGWAADAPGAWLQEVVGADARGPLPAPQLSWAVVPVSDGSSPPEWMFSPPPCRRETTWPLLVPFDSTEESPWLPLLQSSGTGATYPHAVSSTSEVPHALHESNGRVLGTRADVRDMCEAQGLAGRPDGMCPVCLSSQATFPLLTACSHVFCAGCIHELLKNNRGRFICPMCRGTTRSFSYAPALHGESGAAGSPGTRRGLPAEPFAVDPAETAWRRCAAGHPGDGGEAADTPPGPVPLSHSIDANAGEDDQQDGGATMAATSAEEVVARARNSVGDVQAIEGHGQCTYDWSRSIAVLAPSAGSPTTLPRGDAVRARVAEALFPVRADAESALHVPPKLAALVALLRDNGAIAPGEKAVIGVASTTLGHVTRRVLEACFGIRVPFLHSGAAASRRQNTEVLRSFREDVGTTALLVQLNVSGHGLNLQHAKHIIVLEPWLPRAALLQLVGRVARYGQTERELAVHFLWQAGSPEEQTLGTAVQRTGHRLDWEENLSAGLLRALFL